MLADGPASWIYKPGIDAESEDEDYADEGLPPVKIALAVDSGSGGGIAEGAAARSADVWSNSRRSGSSIVQGYGSQSSNNLVNGKSGTKTRLGARSMPAAFTEGSDITSANDGEFMPTLLLFWGVLL